MRAKNKNQILDRLRRALHERKGLIAAYLFGSQSAGEAFEGSDVDVSVLLESSLSLEEQIRLEDELERSVGRRVDLLDLRRANPFLALEIINGIRFIENDPVAADEYELYVLRRAGDLAPLERERRAMLVGADR